jgi:hypothetical protein
MSGHARSLLALLVALVALVSAPVAARAQLAPVQPGAQPAPPLAPPGATVPPPRVPDPSAWRIYEASRRSQGLALVVELFMPGFGSIYGDHWQGAAITWTLNVTGTVATAWGAYQLGFGDSEESDVASAATLAGLGLMVVSRVHGLIDAYRSTGRYNRRLARRFGLEGHMALTPMPLQTSGQSALGLGATWRF